MGNLTGKKSFPDFGQKKLSDKFLVMSRSNTERNTEFTYNECLTTQMLARVAAYSLPLPLAHSSSASSH